MASTSAPPASEARTKAPGERRSDTPRPAATQGEAGLALTGRPVGPSGRLRARTLIVLRWLTITAQVCAVVVTGLLLKFPIPYLPCLALIAVSAWLNVALSLSPAAKRVAKPWEAAWQL